MDARMLFAVMAAVFVLAAAFAAQRDAAADIRWQGVIEIAAGRGEKGPWRQNESRYDYVDDPTVAMHASGDIAVAWVEQKSKDVFFQKISADRTKQGMPVNVSRNPATFSWLPRLVVAPNDAKRIYVLWQEIIFSGGSHGGDILFAYSQDGGATFSAPRNLSSSMGGDGKGRLTRDIWSNGSLDLALDDKGVLYAAWTEYDGMLWLARSNDGGQSFSRPRRIAGDKQLPARGPSLATGPGQTVYLAWTVGEDPAAAIRVAKSGDDGESFSEPQLVGIGQGHADAPKLALDAGGALHLVYAQSGSGPFGRGPFGRYAIRYARSPDGGKSFGAPQTISAPAPDVPAGAGYPSVATDGQGRLFVLWEAYPDPAAAPRGLAFALSRDGGKTFTAPALVPDSRDSAGGSNGSHQGLLMKKLAMNDKGAIAIVNSSLQLDERSRVWLMRGAWAR
jgi:hypothetical protein